MLIGNKVFDTVNNAYIMGILNITPDSFSDAGKWNEPDKALFHVEQMINEGADIIDIGGESTRPGYTFVAQDEEMQRIIPIIEKVKNNFDIPVSVDTYKSEVAKQAIKSGADMINDIWGLLYDEKMAAVISKSNVACCLMHNRKEIDYSDFKNDVKNDFAKIIKTAKAAGIADDKIILDPGVGFAKTYEMNLLAIKNVSELKKWGYPVLLGTSRKSVIGITLDLPVDLRVEGTIATGVFGLINGCSFFRVHDIKENKRALKMTLAILNSK